MRIIKKLDVFILKDFLLLFAGTFSISLFVFIMQFTFRYTDELIGKGITVDILAKFFFYASLTLVPTALPLGLLLASLVTFGNFGERLELLSMKAAGVPLLRILWPGFLFSICCTAGSFYFQNKIGPEATKQLGALVYSMKHKSPELEIQEGTFNDQIKGISIYVEHKDVGTGMLYGVMVYRNEEGNLGKTQIVLADSAQLLSTADKQHLKLTLFNGERFQNMDNQNSGAMKADMPYMRETFDHEVDIIPFADSLNLMDASLFSSNAVTKDIKTIRTSIDSMNVFIDSVGRANYGYLQNTTFCHSISGRKDSAAIVKEAAKSTIPFDSLVAHLSDAEKKEAWSSASNVCQQMLQDCKFRRLTTDDYNKALRLHWVEFYKKFSMSLACMLFFLIGAPLGAIIRKGGLGLPVVISVVIFIFYYIIDVAGVKLAKNGTWVIPFGVWMSTMILLPIGLWLTIKANRDSMVFNIDGYRMFFRKAFGLRERRHINRKEVIIYDPDYLDLHERIEKLVADCNDYVEQGRLRSIPNYKRLYFQYQEDKAVIELKSRLETIIEELHNSQDNLILSLINNYPVLMPDAHTRPFHSKRWNQFAGVFFPLGVFFYFRIWRFRVRLWADMQGIRKISRKILDRIENKHLSLESGALPAQ